MPMHRVSVAFVVLAAVVSASPVLVSGQAKPTSWTVGRTPDGQPDLQGYWTNATYTPLERPAELAGKEFLTEAEAAAYEKQQQLRENSQAKDDIHYDNVIWQSETTGRASPAQLVDLRTRRRQDSPLTREGRHERQPAPQRHAAAGRLTPPSTRSLGERCISWGNEGPPMLGSRYYKRTCSSSRATAPS